MTQTKRKTKTFKLKYLALILVFLRRSANNINLRGAETKHVVNRDVLHGAISRVDLNVTLVREESVRDVFGISMQYNPRLRHCELAKRVTPRRGIERSL